MCFICMSMNGMPWPFAVNRMFRCHHHQSANRSYHCSFLWGWQPANGAGRCNLALSSIPTLSSWHVGHVPNVRYKAGWPGRSLFSWAIGRGNDAGAGRCHHQRTRKKQNRPTHTPLPDGSSIHKLEPLLDRVAPPVPVTTKPGYPLFIEGEYGQKSLSVPWHKSKAAAAADGEVAVADYDYKEPTQLELNAFNVDPKPGELFTTFPHADSPKSIHKVPTVANGKTQYRRIDDTHQI